MTEWDADEVMTEPNESWHEELAGLSFEDAYRRLEETVDELERGELALTDAESLYRQGMELANRCQQLLTEAELRITQIGENRGMVAAPAGEREDDDDDDWEVPPPPPEPDDPSLFEDDEPF